MAELGIYSSVNENDVLSLARNEIKENIKTIAREALSYTWLLGCISTFIVMGEIKIMTMVIVTFFSWLLVFILMTVHYKASRILITARVIEYTPENGRATIKFIVQTIYGGEVGRFELVRYDTSLSAEPEFALIKGEIAKASLMGLECQNGVWTLQKGGKGYTFHRKLTRCGRFV